MKAFRSHPAYRLTACVLALALVLALPLPAPAANNPTLSVAARNAANDAITAKINVGGAGTLLFYTGTQPASPDTAVGAQVLLATLTYSATSFGASSGGTATANAITSGTAVASGTATWCRSLSGGGTAVLDLSVGTSGADVNLGSVVISSGTVVSVTSLTLTHP